jgi:hypothetical protein
MATTVDAAIEAQSEVEAVKELGQRDPSGRYGRRPHSSGRQAPSEPAITSDTERRPEVANLLRIATHSSAFPGDACLRGASARPATSCGAPAELTTGAPPRAIPGSPHHLCFPARGGVGLGGLGVSGAPERPRDEEQLEGKP